MQGLVIAVPAPGSVSGIARKEWLVDTNVLLGGGATTIPVEVTHFTDYNNFRVAPNNTAITQQKKFGRDVTLQGNNQMPNGHFFYWFGWNKVWEFYAANMSALANVNQFELARRLTELARCTFKFGNAPYIETPLKLIPGGCPETIFTTHPDATVFSEGGDTKSTYDVTVQGNPVPIRPGDQLSIVTRWDDQAAIQPLLDMFLKHMLRGLMIRGMG